MKFYCKNCKSVFEPNGWHEYDTKSEECPLCKAGKLVVPIPDYETPEQHEKRTGKPFPDDGAVWKKHKFFTYWECVNFRQAKEDLGRKWTNYVEFVVIADPPVPPPVDWILEWEG